MTDGNTWDGIDDLGYKPKSEGAVPTQAQVNALRRSLMAAVCRHVMQDPPYWTLKTAEPIKAGETCWARMTDPTQPPTVLH